MPAYEDTPDVKPGGIAEKVRHCLGACGSRAYHKWCVIVQVLGSDVEICPFDEMRHGWTTRGDLTDPKVERDVKKAMEKAASFLDRHLK